MQALPRRLQFNTAGFPHSDISGSKATNRLPEAFRRLVASFIAVLGQGIHRALLCLSYGDLHSTFIHTPAHRNHSRVRGFQLPNAYSPDTLAWHCGIAALPTAVRLRQQCQRSVAGSYVKDSRVSSNNETVPPTAGRFALQTHGLNGLPFVGLS